MDKNEKNAVNKMRKMLWINWENSFGLNGEIAMIYGCDKKWKMAMMEWKNGCD